MLRSVSLWHLHCITRLAITSHCKIFSADADVRLARRIRRDTVEKGRDIATVLDQVDIRSMALKRLDLGKRYYNS